MPEKARQFLAMETTVLCNGKETRINFLKFLAVSSVVAFLLLLWLCPVDVSVID